ncbi:MAG: DUF4418 family protein [Fibrobacter sp.]|jgi:hypothetical protein|uniref:DUF4418 family protein n=1 Tax=Fibrobacter sp. TaxID=35828 RepID=UPI001B1FBB9D|nr:DUF4418 family protein [Fibrobacter sp.]MBO7062327.1 DUF4418 family protein [Fibrobacter sp.]MBO7104478.1 DUF4418 family protein [Fibrobacter sp.]
MDQYKLFVIANLVFGVLLVAFAQVILPVCGSMGGIRMRCGTSASIEAILGIALLVTAVVGAAIIKKNAHLVLSMVATAIGVFVSLVPTIIVGTCPHVHMACHAVTAPVFALTGAAIVLFSVVNFVLLKLKRRNEQD